MPISAVLIVDIRTNRGNYKTCLLKYTVVSFNQDWWLVL